MATARPDGLVLYEKRGRRYYPARTELQWDTLPAGHYLITVRPGQRSLQQVVEPDLAGFLAAAEVARDAMAQVLRHATAVRPTGRINPTLQRAFKAYKAIAGDQLILLESAAAWDVVQAGLDAVKAEYERQRRQED